MTNAYEDLVATGAMGGLKRDVLVAASTGIHRLADIRKWFVERGGADAARDATACTVRLVEELVACGHCRLATWGEDKGSSVVVDMAGDELAALVEKCAAPAAASDYFLVSTDVGNLWAARYLALVAEL